ncbi:LuxR C-terminal-related transcriptional regulator [uncultured Roseobacter sp.]|uniref:LuxR C-terminal-related transcriptional regulator n=1 Tax=uncultured Roseobacter sp. TaxID=114847 RepID=UPI0026340CD7|nr:LuxR C-terminal-related transcriptional regulator [uncultured Roseobacter sp.]
MPGQEILTKRESEIASAYVDGLSHKEIAERLCIAPATVRTHLNSIYRKLGVRTKMQLLKEIGPTDVEPEPKRPIRRMALIAVAVLLVSLVAGLVLIPGNRMVASVSAPPSISNLPSVAVLPFDFSQADAEKTAFVTAVARDMVTDLSQFSTVLVYAADTTFAYAAQGMSPLEIAGQLGARYVVSGDAQWHGKTVRVNVQLYEAATSKTVWAERFERPADDLLVLQNEIVTEVVRLVGIADGANSKLRASELSRVQRMPTASLAAYDHFLNGLVLFESYRAEETLQSITEFDRALEIDPLYGRAHAYAGWAYLQDFRNGWSDTPEQSLIEAERRAEKAIEIDPHDPYGHWTMGAIRLYQRRHEQSLAAYQQAIDLNPNNAEMLVHLGWALTYAGEPDKGIEFIESAMERNPRYPGWYLWDLAFAHLVAGRYAETAEVMEQRSPKTTGTYELLALAYAKLGRTEEAEAAREKVLAAAPQTSVARTERVEPFLRPEDLERYLDLMRNAGFPEDSAAPL